MDVDDKVPEISGEYRSRSSRVQGHMTLRTSVQFRTFAEPKLVERLLGHCSYGRCPETCWGGKRKPRFFCWQGTDLASSKRCPHCGAPLKRMSRRTIAGEIVSIDPPIVKMRATVEVAHDYVADSTDLKGEQGTAEVMMRKAMNETPVRNWVYKRKASSSLVAPLVETMAVHE